MGLADFLEKQFIKVVQWTESEEGVLAWRYPMQDLEIMNGAKLTVRESQAAVFVNEGRVADVFGPGLYTLETRTLPLLTNLMNWNKEFKSPFKSDVYFFSARLQVNQGWGTATPITIRDKEFGAVRLRGYGIYSYHVADPRAFYSKVSGTRGSTRFRIWKANCATRFSVRWRILSGRAIFRSWIWPLTRSNWRKRFRVCLTPHSQTWGWRSIRSSSRASRCRMNCRSCSINESA